MSKATVTLNNISDHAADIIDMLKKGQIDINVAKEIRGFLDTTIQAAKVQVDRLNAIPKHLKEQLTFMNITEIVGTLPDPEMDNTMKAIEEQRSEPYKISNIL